MDLRELLKRHEGLRLKPYRDTVGKLTIGHGRNLDDVGISEAEAQTLLDNDILRAWGEAMKQVPAFTGMDRARQAVVVCMIFQLGPVGFAAFKKFMAAIEDEDYALAAAEMLKSRWAEQVPARSRELAAMMRTGRLPAD